MVADLAGPGPGLVGVHGCHNKSLRIRWPHTTEVQSLAALEASRLEGALLGLDSGWSPGGSFVSSPSLWWRQTSLGLCGPRASLSFLPPPSHACLLRVSVPLCVCLVRTLAIGFGAHLDNPG